MKQRIFFFLFLTGILFAVALSASAAGGTGPGDALSPTGVAQTVAAHSAQWYGFNYSGNKSRITATLDANGAGGVRLAIYTPEQVASWQRGDKLKEIGIGSSIQGHDLGWVGQFPFSGTFYAVVYNDSDANVSVTVRVTGDAVTLPTMAAPATATTMANPFATPRAPSVGLNGKIAFVDAAGGVLYTVNGDGSNLQRVSFGLDPQWNHSGTQIALAREGPVAGIFTVDANGANERLVYGAPQVRAPDWSPDDTRLVFSRQARIKGGGESCFRDRCFSRPEDRQWELTGMNAPDGSTFDVRTTQHAFTPTWNKDGARIAYEDPAIGLMQTTINSNDEPFPFIGDLRVTSPTFNPLKIMSPQYSPDGKSIVYMVVQQPTWQIALANADGGNQHLLTQNNILDFVHYHNVSPVWSPDGSQILFLSDRNGKWEFFTMNADGSNQRQVLKNITDQIQIGYEFESERMMSWSK